MGLIWILNFHEGWKINNNSVFIFINRRRYKKVKGIFFSPFFVEVFRGVGGVIGAVNILFISRNTPEERLKWYKAFINFLYSWHRHFIFILSEHSLKLGWDFFLKSSLIFYNNVSQENGNEIVSNCVLVHQV